MVKYFEKFGHTCTLKLDDGEIEENYFKNRSQFQRTVIKWTTIDPHSNLTRDFLKSHSAIISEMKFHLQYHPHTIHPFSQFKFVWECIMASIFFTGLIYVPFLYFDYIDTSSRNEFQHLLVMKVVKSVCIVDFALRFFIGCADERKFKIILSRRKIAWEYLRGLFIFDFMTNVPFLFGILFRLTPDDEEFHFIKITTLFRIFRLSTFIKYCQRMLQRLQVNDKYLEIFKLLSYWIIWIHWAACLHVVPGLIMARFQPNVLVGAWYENPSFQHHDAYGKYVICLFKSVKTFMGTGYIKDLQPTEYFDKIYASLLTIVGRIGLCITLAYIYQIIQGVLSSTLRYDEMMVQLNKYTSCNRLTKSTKMKLKKNYDYMFCENYFNEREILHTISMSLRQEIMVHNTRHLVESSPFFENLPFSLIMKIISVLSMELFFENDVIYSTGDAESCVYFITSGSVAYYTPSEKEVCHFIDGDYFGEMTLVSDVNYRFCKAIALETTECYKLERRDFLKIANAYPDLLQKVETLALERMNKVLMTEERENNQSHIGYIPINQPQYTAEY